MEPQCRRPGLPFEVLQQRKGLWTAHGLSQTGIGISLSCLLACLQGVWAEGGSPQPCAQRDAQWSTSCLKVKAGVE